MYKLTEDEYKCGHICKINYLDKLSKNNKYEYYKDNYSYLYCKNIEFFNNIVIFKDVRLSRTVFPLVDLIPEYNTEFIGYKYKTPIIKKCYGEEYTDICYDHIVSSLTINVKDIFYIKSYNVDNDEFFKRVFEWISKSYDVVLQDVNNRILTWNEENKKRNIKFFVEHAEFCYNSYLKQKQERSEKFKISKRYKKKIKLTKEEIYEKYMNEINECIKEMKDIEKYNNEKLKGV